MLTYEKIRNLCKENGITVTKLESDCGFSKGSLCRVSKSQPSMERVQKIADYFGISVGNLTGEETEYYIDEETAEVAQQIAENKELGLLFSAAKDASPEDLITVHQMLLALKRKEGGEY